MAVLPSDIKIYKSDQYGRMTGEEVVSGQIASLFPPVRPSQLGSALRQFAKVFIANTNTTSDLVNALLYITSDTAGVDSVYATNEVGTLYGGDTSLPAGTNAGHAGSSSGSTKWTFTGKLYADLAEGGTSVRSVGYYGYRAIVGSQFNNVRALLAADGKEEYFLWTAGSTWGGGAYQPELRNIPAPGFVNAYDKDETNLCLPINLGTLSSSVQYALSYNPNLGGGYSGYVSSSVSYPNASSRTNVRSPRRIEIHGDTAAGLGALRPWTVLDPASGEVFYRGIAADWPSGVMNIPDIITGSTIISFSACPFTTCADTEPSYYLDVLPYCSPVWLERNIPADANMGIIYGDTFKVRIVGDNG